MARILYSVPEGRHQMGDIGHTTFYELVKAGKIKIVKIGRRTFISHDEIERYVASLAGDVA
ncbi:helix-turn-helix domain-containing protein [Ammonicoccus fulvus]|uniref:Helix-turn-helix domain-containing protein n=1 Tax=Ammonicoccus fulvus TaxID=3138240 RepID=A0ABZ3FNN0_9ACTN